MIRMDKDGEASQCNMWFSQNELSIYRQLYSLVSRSVIIKAVVVARIRILFMDSWHYIRWIYKSPKYFWWPSLIFYIHLQLHEEICSQTWFKIWWIRDCRFWWMVSWLHQQTMTSIQYLSLASCEFRKLQK